MDSSKLSIALSHMERRNLYVVGFARKRWWEKPQWNMVQNTAAIWKASLLSTVKGFAPECNGTEETVYTEESGNFPLAGIEDFHLMLRDLKIDQGFRWGLAYRLKPLFWNYHLD